MAALALNTVLVRIGWIFKTESVIIPAFLDSIAGSAWLRGLLPVVSRLGQSLPPFFLSRRIKLMPQKRALLFTSALGMALPFLVLAVGLASLGAAPRAAYPAIFLVLYGLFFACTGLNMLAVGTLQGKLVRPDRRGRLLAIATMGGSLPAIGFAWWLLPRWLEQGEAGWAPIFGFTASCFGFAALASGLVREPRDAFEEPASGALAQLRSGWAILRRDHDYRRLVIVTALFTTSLILIPHYQSLGRVRLGLAAGDMMLWVVAQTAAVGVASLVIGPLADRVGNRATLRVVVFGAAFVPSLALLLSHLEPDVGRPLYTLVFVGVGWMPLGFRLTTNYILELAPADDHALYLSLSQLCTAAVILSSPLFGLLVDLLGYELVFLAVSGLIVAGGLLTFGLAEPRQRSSGAPRSFTKS